MKFDFNYYNPTKIYFGKTALNNLKDELKLWRNCSFSIWKKLYKKEWTL